MKPKIRTRGAIMVLIAAVCYGSAGAVAKVAYAEGATPVFVLTMRFTIAFVILWCYSLAVHRRKEMTVARKQLGVLFITGGLFNVITTMCFFSALLYIPVSLQVMLHSLYPILINLFAVVVFREKMVSKQAVALAMAFSGIIMMVWAPGIYLNWIGVVLALVSALSNSSYVIMLGNKHIEQLDSITVTTYISLFGAISFAVIALFTGQLGANVSVKGWLAILSIAIFTTVIGTITMYLGVKDIGAPRASIICTFEPVVSAMLGIFVLGERLILFQVAGAVLILSAVVLVNTIQTPSAKLYSESPGC